MDDKELRLAILRITRDSDVQVRRPMFASDYLSRVGLPQGELRRVQRALNYLHEKRCLEVVRAGPQLLDLVVGIKAEGIDMLERPEDHGKQHTGPIFNAPVGSVQVGNHNTAHVTQNVGGDLKQLVDALMALRDDTAHDPTRAAVHAVAAQAVDEVTQHHSVTARLTGFLHGLGQLVQSTGAVVPAYNAIYALAPALNIHGLPPPPSST